MNHVASYFEFGTHFRVLSRAETKFNPTLWAGDQSEFKSVYPLSLAARKNACKVEWWLSVNRDLLLILSLQPEKEMLPRKTYE